MTRSPLANYEKPESAHVDSKQPLISLLPSLPRCPGTHPSNGVADAAAGSDTAWVSPTPWVVTAKPVANAGCVLPVIVLGTVGV